MPVNIPLLPQKVITNLINMNLPEIGYEVTSTLLGEDIPPKVISKIVKDAFTFKIPLRKLSRHMNVLELFHGPTLAFKDVGARFMAGLFEFLNKDEDHEITVLAATSGDTGSAVASAFYNRPGIRVVILFPSGKVSPIQEKMLTTMGGNINALEIDGSFDNCQNLVKEAFADRDLNHRLNLTSANSINFARLFPQTFYYFYAFGQLGNSSCPMVFSVPSGNFGNLTAGLMAKKMGLPVRKFIASTNINRSVPIFLKSGTFKPEPTKHTITNAMDVGNPGNFPRILELYKGDNVKLRSDLTGYWFTDSQTKEAMRFLMDEFDYQSDPHGSVAFLGLSEYIKHNECEGIFLETAHPVKFGDIVEKATGRPVELPPEIGDLLTRKQNAIKMKASFDEIKAYLLSSTNFN
jgi:threonine synthase